jgi:hypothetical protein
MAVKSKELEIYISENLKVSELYEILKLEEKEALDKSEKEKQAEVAYFDSFIGNYVMLIHNATSRGLFHITGNIRLDSNACNTISIVKNQSITTYEGHCNYLWFLPKREVKDWWFISKEQYEEVLKQYNNLTNLIFGYETTRNSD